MFSLESGLKGLLAATFIIFAIGPASATSPDDIVSGGTVMGSGELSGRNDHVASGSVSVIEYDGKTYVAFSDDFEFDGAPDPYVGFGMDDYYNANTTVAPLVTDSGAQLYRVPDAFELEGTTQVMLWCRMFGVPLAVATLE